MAKLVLTDIAGGFGSTTLYNANNALVEAALENTLSLDGTTPNGMTASLDMNSQNIINVLSPNDNLHVANKAYVDSLLSGTTDTGSAQLRVDLADTANTKGASLVGVEDSAGNFTGTSVETVLAEIIADLAANTASNGASTIGIQDSASKYVATTVEAALAEFVPVGIGFLGGHADGAGTVNVITADFTPNVSLTDGVIVSIKAFGAITTTLPTFAPDGLAAKTIVKGDNDALVLENITSANQTLLLQYDSTLDKWILLNPREPKYRGALVIATSNQSYTNTSNVFRAFAGEDHDTDSFHDNSTNNERLTVGAGVDRVIVAGFCMWDANLVGERGITISKNNSFDFKGRTADFRLSNSASKVCQQSVTSTVLNVSEGDYFTLHPTQTSGGSLNSRGVAGGTETWFSIRVVE